jgi:hypothetical protein
VGARLRGAEPRRDHVRAVARAAVASSRTVKLEKADGRQRRGSDPFDIVFSSSGLVRCALRPTRRSNLERSGQARPSLAARFFVPTHQHSGRNISPYPGQARSDHGHACCALRPTAPARKVSVWFGLVVSRVSGPLLACALVLTPDSELLGAYPPYADEAVAYAVIAGAHAGPPVGLAIALLFKLLQLWSRGQPRPQPSSLVLPETQKQRDPAG